ncbi:MAG: thiamine biosynthesis protein ApbE [Bacteroidetes bacterium HGW-Bacteroidetes-13]|nr:MAG: thiamine biosynthesis protein ApbE [Bacteroidetes bacterium HGW-Bacteroidetes-13]
MERFVFALIVLFTSAVSGQKIYKRALSMLGSPFEITVVANDSISAEKALDMAVAEVRRVENLISDWKPDTEISAVNRNAGKQAVKVSNEVFDLVSRSLKISELTEGAFDVSYASMDRIWKFDGSMTAMPTPEAIQKSVERVGYHNIIMDNKNTTIFLKNEGMKIGLGGIGQGYIADNIKALLIANGFHSGIVNVSGDVSAWGTMPDGKPWSVGIVNPMNKNKIFATFPLIDSAVETSGSYEKFVVFDGKRYSHIIDPRTGYPAMGIVSVSVFSKQTEISDALATSIFVMGKDVGLNLINQLKGIECIIIDDQGKIYSSEGIKLETKQL